MIWALNARLIQRQLPSTGLTSPDAQQDGGDLHSCCVTCRSPSHTNSRVGSSIPGWLDWAVLAPCLSPVVPVEGQAGKAEGSEAIAEGTEEGVDRAIKWDSQCYLNSRDSNEAKVTMVSITHQCRQHR